MLTLMHKQERLVIGWSVKRADRNDSLKYPRNVHSYAAYTVIKYTLNCAVGGELLCISIPQ